ncbi:MAG: hypothetical protein O2968_20870, partial [Acidobacteria bacterium]|nr:hypothetical protein [Acidobacteriota bacterium]
HPISSPASTYRISGSFLDWKMLLLRQLLFLFDMAAATVRWITFSRTLLEIPRIFLLTLDSVVRMIETYV